MRYAAFMGMMMVGFVSAPVLGQGGPGIGEPEGPNSGYQYAGWNFEAWNYYNLAVDGVLYSDDIDGMKFDTEWLLQWPEAADVMDGASDNKFSGFDPIEGYGFFVGWDMTYQLASPATSSPEVYLKTITEFGDGSEDQLFFYNDYEDQLNGVQAFSTGTYDMRLDPDMMNHAYWNGFANVPAVVQVRIKFYEVWWVDGVGPVRDGDHCLAETMYVGLPYDELPGR